MRLFRADQIDKEKWDEMVLASAHPSLYCIAWFLDAAYPNWHALVWQTGDQYTAAVPLCTKTIGFLQWLQIPYYVQHTGLIYSKDTLPDDYLDDFFASGMHKKYMAANIAFAPALCDALEKYNNRAPWLTSRRKNYVLALGKPYEDLFSAFNSNRKRNLKKAYKEGWICEPSTDIEAILKMYRDNQASRQKDIDTKALETIRTIFRSAQERGLAELYQVSDQTGAVSAYTLFVRFGERIYFLFGASSPAGKELSTSSLPFDYVIKKYAGQAMTLDFEGGNVQGIGHYFASFGATTEEYLSFSYHKLKALIGYRK